MNFIFLKNCISILRDTTQSSTSVLKLRQTKSDTRMLAVAVFQKGSATYFDFVFKPNITERRPNVAVISKCQLSCQAPQWSLPRAYRTFYTPSQNSWNTWRTLNAYKTKTQAKLTHRDIEAATKMWRQQLGKNMRDSVECGKCQIERRTWWWKLLKAAAFDKPNDV